jgi:hypothetical protein
MMNRRSKGWRKGFCLFCRKFSEEGALVLKYQLEDGILAGTLGYGSSSLRLIFIFHAIYSYWRMQFIHISWKQKRNKLSSPNLL